MAEKLAALFHLPYCQIVCRDGDKVQEEAYADMSLLADFWERAERSTKEFGGDRLFPGETGA
jgi:hypothetical protein